MKAPTGSLVRTMVALLAFVDVVPAGSPRRELQAALHALAYCFGFDVAVKREGSPPEPRVATAALALLAFALDELADPQRAAASACYAWARELVVPVILTRAGWRRSPETIGRWIDPHAPKDLCDEDEALARLERDLAA